MKKNKFLSVIIYLLIIFPGKIAFPMFLILILTFFNSSLELFYSHQDYVYLIKEFVFSILTLISLILIFKKNKFITFICIMIQLLFIFYTFKIENIKYWYYSLPVILYLISNSYLTYQLFKHYRK